MSTIQNTTIYIQKIVCDYFNMPIDSLQSKTRKREIVQARQIAMFFSRSLPKLSLASIGAQIGGKDHATVLHACKTVNNLIDTDKFFRADVEEIEKRIDKINNDSQSVVDRLKSLTKQELINLLIAERQLKFKRPTRREMNKNRKKLTKIKHGKSKK